MKRRWQLGRRLRQTWQTDYQVESLYNRFLGKKHILQLEDDEIQINRFWPTIQAQLPSLFFQSPTFRIVTKEREATGDALLRVAYGEAVLHEISTREFNLETATQLALLQSFFSIGVLKVIYEPKTIPNPRKGEPIMTRNLDGTPVLDDFGEPVPLLDPGTGRGAKEPDEHMSDEAYRFEWVNADTMLLPDQGPDMRRWTWIGEEITVTLDEAKEDERFPKRLRDQFRPNAREDGMGGLRRDMSMTVERRELEGDDAFTYVEIWDIRKRRYYVFADGQGDLIDNDFLIDDDYPEGIEEHPYAILPGFTPIIGPDQSPWPLPHVYNWLSLQDEYEIRRKQMIEGGKRSARKMFYDDSTFENEEQALKALQSPVDMEAVKITDSQRPPQGITDPDLPAHLSQDLVFMDRDWVRTTGLPGARIGGTRAGSATEANLEANAGQLRDSDLRNKVNRWLSSAGQKMFQLVQKTLTMGMWVRLRGMNDSELRDFLSRVYPPDMLRSLEASPSFKRAFEDQFGTERAFQVTREELEFQAQVLVVPGSSRVRNLESDRDQFLQLIQILGAAPQIMQSRILLKHLMSLFDLDDEALVDEMQASAQRSIEIEMEKAGRNQGGGGSPGAQAPANNGAAAGGLGALLGG